MSRRTDLEAIYQELEFRRCAVDFVYFCENYVNIEDKSTPSGYTLFKLLPHQHETAHALLNDRKLIVLKARQLGLTTVIMAFILWRTLFQPGFSSLVLSHGEMYAKSNIARLRLMFGLLPAWMLARLPKANNASGTFELEFPAGVTSTVVSKPAVATVGAGTTLDFIFLDEFGLMEYADQAYETLMPTVDAAMASTRKGCVLAIASTARGSTNAFARTWRAPSTFRKLFFPWSCSPNFTQDMYDHEVAEYTSKGEPWKIFQERPSSPEEAFRKSGAAFFTNLPPIDEIEEFPAHLRGRILQDVNGGLYFEHDPHGPLRLAEEKPERGGFYTLGVDPAHGVAADSTVGTVVTYDEQGVPYIAAYWASNTLSQADAAEQLDLLGRWFAGCQRAALLVPETTGGHAELLIHVWRQNDYPNLYSFRETSTRNRRMANQIGITTAGSDKRRNLLLGKLVEVLPILGNLYPALRDELGTFVRRDGSDKAAADVGCHDDHVFAVCLALWALAERGSSPVVSMGEARAVAQQTFSVGPEIEKRVAATRAAQRKADERWERRYARRQASQRRRVR